MLPISEKSACWKFEPGWIRGFVFQVEGPASDEDLRIFQSRWP